MSDNTRGVTPSTNTGVCKNTRDNINHQEGISDQKIQSKKSSVNSDHSSDLVELKQDIKNLNVLANQINDKIVRTRMNLSSSFSTEEEIINAVKSITESYQNINYFVKEDNINSRDIPEFAELSSHIHKLQDQVYKVISDPVQVKRPKIANTDISEILKIKASNPQFEEQPLLLANPNTLSNNYYVNHNDISIGNLVMNEACQEDFSAMNDNDVNLRSDLRTPLLDKEDYSDNTSSNNQGSAQYYQNTSNTNLEVQFSSKSDSKFQKIGLSVFLSLVCMLIILYFIS